MMSGWASLLNILASVNVSRSAVLMPDMNLYLSGGVGEGVPLVCTVILFLWASRV